MITLLSELDFEHFSPRLYIVAQTDETSQQRVKQLETNKKSRGNIKESFLIYFLKKILAIIPSPRLWGEG